MAHHVRIEARNLSDSPSHFMQDPKKDSLAVPSVHEKKGKKEDVLKSATVVEEEGDSDSDEYEFSSPDEPARVSKDRKVRGKYEYAVLRKVKELHAVEERLYYVRWDKTRSSADQKIELMNLAKEYARLKKVLDMLLEKSDQTFEESLQLGAVGLPKDLDDEAYQPVANVAADASISNVKVSDDLVLDELESQKFMRTKSTQTLKDKQPKQKWDGMMTMFKEWKHHNTVAEGQHVLNRKPSTAAGNEQVILHNSEDLIALRQAIHQLKQRKNLSKNDQALLKKMQQKLADMTGATGPV